MALKVWLPLDGDLHNQGCSNIDITNSNCTVANTGKIGQCYYFDGSSYLSAPSPEDIKSVCFWLKTTVVASRVAFADYKSKLGFGFNASKYMIVSCADWNIQMYTNFSAIVDNQWTHIAIVKTNDENDILLYINGILQTVRGSTNNWGHTTDTLMIGKRSSGTNMTCYINDFRAYDHCLSTAEVREISQGLVLHYKLDRIPTTITNAYNYPYFDYNSDSSGWSHWGRSGHIGSFTQNTDQQYIYYKDKASNHAVSNGIDATGEYLVYQSPAFDGGYRSLQCIVKETNSTPITESILFPTWNNRDGGAPVHKWTRVISLGDGFYLCQVDGAHQDGNNDLIGFFVCPGYTIYFSAAWCENDREVCSDVLFSIDSVEDSSGYGHNGTITGSPAIITSPKRYSNCIHFGANTAKIKVSNLTTTGFGSSYSFVWWGRRATHSGMMFWGFSNGIRLNGMYNGTLWNTGDSSNNPIYKIGTTTTITAPTATDWHHYAMTGNGTKCYLYIDGELYGEAKTWKAISGTEIWLNGWDSGTSYTNTDMDMSDFRIYCTALTAEDILSLYHTSAKIDNKGGIHTYELSEDIGIEINAKFINNSATSMTYDVATDTYTIVSPVGTSAWGYGVRLADTPALMVPYGAAYRWTAEVWTPVALNINTDYNNTAGGTDVNWAGNDNDATGTRLASNVAIPANKWTRIYRGASNTNSGNTNHLPIRDYSSLGLVTNGQSNPVTWKVRHLQWYLVDTTFKPQIKKTGVFEAEHFTEVEHDLNRPAQFNKQMFSVNGNEIIES